MSQEIFYAEYKGNSVEKMIEALNKANDKSFTSCVAVFGSGSEAATLILRITLGKESENLGYLVDREPLTQYQVDAISDSGLVICRLSDQYIKQIEKSYYGNTETAFTELKYK